MRIDNIEKTYYGTCSFGLSDLQLLTLNGANPYGAYNNIKLFSPDFPNASNLQELPFPLKCSKGQEVFRFL
jgi:hypothetical protein